MRGNSQIKKVIIKIISKRREFDERLTDLIGNLLESESMYGKRQRDFTFKDAIEEIVGDTDTEFLEKLTESFEDSQAIEVITEGFIMEDNDGNIEIEYDENDSEGANGTVIRIIFNRNEPGLVSVVREGEMNTMLSFESGKRHKSIYNTPYMPFELSINTIEVKNTVLTDGRLFLNYLIEIKGLSCDRCTIDFEITQP